jgi:hypothetical protein
MDTTTCSAPIGLVSPNLRESLPATDGVYKIQHVWVLDATTARPIRVDQNVTLGA